MANPKYKSYWKSKNYRKKKKLGWRTSKQTNASHRCACLALWARARWVFLNLLAESRGWIGKTEGDETVCWVLARAFYWIGDGIALGASKRANGPTWARFLAGLPGRFLHPVVASLLGRLLAGLTNRLDHPVGRRGTVRAQPWPRPWAPPPRASRRARCRWPPRWWVASSSSPSAKGRQWLRKEGENSRAGQ